MVLLGSATGSRYHLSNSSRSQERRGIQSKARDQMVALGPTNYLTDQFVQSCPRQDRYISI
jgi:hypothetical protein